MLLNCQLLHLESVDLQKLVTDMYLFVRLSECCWILLITNPMGCCA